MKQLAGGKHMENNYFLRILKFKMIRLSMFLLAQWPWITWITATTFLAWFWWLFHRSTIAMLETHILHCMYWLSRRRCFYWLCGSGGCHQGPIYLHMSHPWWYHSTTILKPPSHSYWHFCTYDPWHLYQIAIMLKWLFSLILVLFVAVSSFHNLVTNERKP